MLKKITITAVYDAPISVPFWRYFKMVEYFDLVYDIANLKGILLNFVNALRGIRPVHTLAYSSIPDPGF